MFEKLFNKNKDKQQTQETMTSEEETLTAFAEVANKVDIQTHFIQDEEGAIVGSYLVVQCGDKFMQSEPNLFDWPMTPMPLPEAFKDAMN